MKRVALYVRVSTQEQKRSGLSVDSQIEALEAYSKEHGYYIVDIYNDAGFSARKSYKKRPALLRLIEDCNNDKIDLILFTKLDRWFRSVADYYEVQRELDKTKVAWRAIWEDYETETSSGVFKVNIMLSVAQSEADRTSERIKAVNEYRRAQGKFVGGHAPVGYRKANGEVYIDEAMREPVQAFFDTYLTFYSPVKAIEAAEKLGLHLTYERAHNMLHSAFYAGDAYGYKCEAYITLEQHELIQHIMKQRYRPPKDKYNYLFSGIIFCYKCGHVLSGKRKHRTYSSGKKSIYKSYQCNHYYFRRDCTNGSIMHESTVENYLLNELDNILHKYNIEAEARKKEVKNVDKEIEKLEAKLKRLKLLFEEGDIEIEDYKDKRDIIKMDIKKLESLNSSDKLYQLPSNWKEVYLQLDEEHKKAFWRGLIKSIVRNEDKSFTVELL